MNRIQEVLTEMHQIMNPGEYGLGTEPESIPDDDKKAWIRVGNLRDELESLLIAKNMITQNDYVAFDPPIRALQLSELTPEIVADIQLLYWCKGDWEYHPDETYPHYDDYIKYLLTGAFDDGYPMSVEVLILMERIAKEQNLRTVYIEHLVSTHSWL